MKLFIKSGCLVKVEGDGSLPSLLNDLSSEGGYDILTEVGISFNRVCSFVHDWPSASNEGRPGVHVAVGGDPEKESKEIGKSLVHLDMMSSATDVEVNRRTFLRTM
jgi:hypothetical protein